MNSYLSSETNNVAKTLLISQPFYRHTLLGHYVHEAGTRTNIYYTVAM